MTRIPVERKRGGLPWWAWLLIVLAVIALIWLLFALFNNDEGEGVDTAVTEASPAAIEEPLAEPSPLDVEEPLAEPSPEASPLDVEEPSPEASPAAGDQTEIAEPITDVSTILTAADPASLAGTQVQLEGVSVQSVVGDTTFWVGPSQDQQLFVVLEEDLSAGPTEGQVDVNAGQTVTISGEIRELPSIEEARQQWGLSEANSAELENQQIYLHAEQVEITSQ